MKNPIKPIARTAPFQFIIALCISLTISLGLPQDIRATIMVDEPAAQTTDGSIDFTKIDFMSAPGIIPYSVTTTEEYQGMTFAERAALVNGGSGGGGQNFVIEICVLVIALVIVAIGGCAIKKLIDKLPPPNPPPPPPPTNSPSWTNAPGGGPITLIADTQNPVATAALMPMARVGNDNNEGMQSWYIASHPHVLTNPAPYIDNGTGRPYTHLVVTSIEGTPTLESPHWKVVGSRMMWLSLTNRGDGDKIIGTYFLAIYDSKGNVLGKVTEPINSIPRTSANDLQSAVRVLPHEIGTNHFFRLSLPSTNGIAILTEPVTSTGTQ